MNVVTRLFRTTTRSTLNTLKTISSNGFSTIKIKEKDDPETPDSTTTLIFNLDGTLVDTSNLLLKSIETLHNDLDINNPPSLNESHMGENVKNILKKIYGAQEDPRFQNPIYLTEQTAKLSEIFIKLIENDNFIQIPPEHHETLLKLAEEGIHILLLYANIDSNRSI